jgi:hypothetical protein
MQFPQLSTVQMYILFLNKPPSDIASADNAAVWSLTGSTVAIAQTLGLHMDPTTWKLPSWEIRLRKRLWWSVVVEHHWRALTQGRPPLLFNENWDVMPLTSEDFVVDRTATSENTSNTIDNEHFMQLCTLTLISDDVCRLFQ